jgi:hypothetical protein
MPKGTFRIPIRLIWTLKEVQTVKETRADIHN